MIEKVAWHRALLFIPILHLLLATAALAEMSAKTSPSSGIHVQDGVMVAGEQKSHLTKSLPPKKLSHVPGKMIVKLKEGMTVEQLRSSQQKHALKISEKRLANTVHRRFKDHYDVRAAEGEDLVALSAELMANPAVEYAEPVSISYTQLVPNDTLYPQQWSHKKTQAESGWNITTGSASVVIAVVDTGVAYNHPDLAGNIWHDPQGKPGKDFVDILTTSYTSQGYQLIAGEDYTGVDFDPSDYNGHGTHVAGIIAAAGNNGVGVSGVCPMCKIMPVRAGFSMNIGGTDYGLFESDDIANAIIYAADNGARVINMSFGGPSSTLINNAVDYADSKGVLLVAAAGNDNTSQTANAYPAAHGNVLAVGATTQDDSRAFYSNYGAWVGVSAPGGDNIYPILSTVPTTGSLSDPSGYRGLYGTSMASPYVAGLAGLILSKNPNLSNRQVAQALRQGADLFNVDIPNSPVYLGAGRVNVYKTLEINSVSTASVTVSSPTDDFLTGASIPVSGASTAPYQLFYGAGLYPASWTQIGSGQAGTGLFGTLDPAWLAAPFGDYTLKVSAQDQNGKVDTFVHGSIGKQFLPGWPQTYSSGPGYLWNAPSVADIDQDGLDEIVVTGQDSSTRATITVLKQDGTPAAGNWPQTVPYSNTDMEFGAAVGDLDHDGNLEIVAPVLNAGQNHSLRVWDHLGNLRWSKVLEAGNPALNVTLADLYGDGKKEIITETYNSKLWVLDGQGNAKWSYPLGEYDSWYNEKTVAVADLDGDGKKEIVKNVIRNVKFSAGDIYRTMGGTLMVFNTDGSVRWKHDWPEAGEPLTTKYYEIFPVGSPVVGDLNGDGSPETMVQVNVWKGDDTGTSDISTRFYAFDAKGSVLPGWPVSVPGYPSWSEMAIADLNRNGHRELVCASRDSVLAIRENGSMQFPPVPLQAQGNLTVADVTGDGSPDIVAYDGTHFNVIQADGSLSTLPITARNGGDNVHNTPILTDLNKSGSEKLIFPETGTRPVLWAWDLQVPHVAEAEQWPMFGFDPLHSGLSGSPSLSPVAISTSGIPVGVLGVPYSVSLTATGGSAPYYWTLTKGALLGGFTLSPGGLLSGTPAASGSATFTVQAADAQGALASRSFTLTASGLLPPAMVSGSFTRYFSLLQDAYESCADGDTIELQGVTFAEAPRFDRNVTVNLMGGFDGSFATAGGATFINGCLTVSNGKVKVDNVLLR
jgi:subtilisin family serine protease